jgi:hypothetical protein
MIFYLPHVTKALSYFGGKAVLLPSFLVQHGGAWILLVDGLAEAAAQPQHERQTTLEAIASQHEADWVSLALRLAMRPSNLSVASSQQDCSELGQAFRLALQPRNPPRRPLTPAHLAILKLSLSFYRYIDHAGGTQPVIRRQPAVTRNISIQNIQTANHPWPEKMSDFEPERSSKVERSEKSAEANKALSEVSSARRKWFCHLSADGGADSNLGTWVS